MLFDESYIRYFGGFTFLATERPVAFAVNVAGDAAVFVPEFEVERVRAESEFDRVESYPEYPGEEHPMRILQRVLEDMGMRGAVGAEQDGYPGILGYQGPALSEVGGRDVFPLAPFIEGMLVRKSENEVALIRESARWCEHAHRLLQEYSRPGATEAEASLRASHEATLAMLEALGPSYDGQQSSSDGATAGYRGQIGRRSAWAHAVAHNIRFEPGDMLVTRDRRAGLGLQRRARARDGRRRADRRDAPPVRPHAAPRSRRRSTRSVPASRVRTSTARCSRYFEANGLLPYWRQHVGHAIGLRNHEAPFLDVGDHTPVEPGMVFTIEPGVYAPGLGGFRHSDTVLVTAGRDRDPHRLPVGPREPDDPA